MDLVINIDKLNIKTVHLNQSAQHITLDPTNDKKSIEILKQYSPDSTHIYGKTKNQDLKTNKLINIKDHINKSGHNPLIGHQSEFKENFFDISNLYNSKTGIVTTGLGKYYDEHHKQYLYPSSTSSSHSC